MINYSNGSNIVQATEIICVTWKADSKSQHRVKAFIVRREDGKLGLPSTIIKDGQCIYAKNYEIGEWSEVGDK